MDQEYPGLEKKGMSYPIFPQLPFPQLPLPHAYSPRTRTEDYSPGRIEQNVSYARGRPKPPQLVHPSQSQQPRQTAQPPQPPQPQRQQPPQPPQPPQLSLLQPALQPSHRRHLSLGSESDEDERFLRLAKEALVATAGAKGDGTENLMVDPTIQDLLRRLQYASLPHGNPIKRSKKIRANDKGQLEIQSFYKNFPNLSNNIFMELEGIGVVNSHASASIDGPTVLDKLMHHPSNSRNAGWNFLVGEPMVYATESERAKTAAASAPAAEELAAALKGAASDAGASEDEIDTDDESGEPRKFACHKCHMLFRRSSDLKRHEKQHLTIPPNICKLCGKGFARKDALKRHMGTLTCKRNAGKRLYAANLSYIESPHNLTSTALALASNDPWHI